MDKLPVEIKSLGLDLLFLPGTRDFGAYDTTQKLPIFFEKYVYIQVNKRVGFCHTQVSLTNVVNLSSILKFVRHSNALLITK